MKFYRNLYHASLMLVFLNFSMLLNCMGVMILQLSQERQSYEGLGLLEIFKDIPIAIISIFSTLFIAKFGNAIAIKIALLLALVCCIVIPFIHLFWFFKIWFALIGISFAISKIAVFSSLGNFSNTETEFAKSMNAIESMFMLGVFLINISFAFLLSTEYQQYWKFGFWGIALLIIINLIIISIAQKKILIVDKDKNDILGKEKISFNEKNLSIVILFYSIIFSIVFLEQSLNSWLPSFYREHFKSTASIALQSTAILAFFSFLGRLFTSKKIQNYSWKNYILFSIISSLTIIVITNTFFNSFFSKNSLIIYAFPLIGFFLAPLYPVFNSKFLSKQNKEDIKLNVAYINLFSSLGSSIGSFIMASLFQNQQSSKFLFFLSLILLIILMLGYFFIQKINNIEDRDSKNS